MAGVAPSVVSTKETTNYARLCRLLVDLGTLSLRDTFDRIHAPANLYTVLASPPVHSILQGLFKGTRGAKKILNPVQWGKLYPAVASSVSSANFDITLLMILLRNICCLTPPATGWDALPHESDKSREADIVRLKYFRNTVYGHAEQASVDNATFNTYWQNIREVLVRLGGAKYKAAVDRLKTECMDPVIEEHYKGLLEQWKKDEYVIKDQLSEMGNDIKYIKKTLARIATDNSVMPTTEGKSFKDIEKSTHCCNHTEPQAESSLYPDITKGRVGTLAIGTVAPLNSIHQYSKERNAEQQTANSGAAEFKGYSSEEHPTPLPSGRTRNSAQKEETTVHHQPIQVQIPDQSSKIDLPTKAVPHEQGAFSQEANTPKQDSNVDTTHCEMCDLKGKSICIHCYLTVCEKCKQIYNTDLCDSTQEGHDFKEFKKDNLESGRKSELSSKNYDNMNGGIGNGGRDWSCIRCTFLNPPDHKICAMCATTRGLSLAGLSQGGTRVCRRCTFHNKENAKVCVVCHSSLDFPSVETFI